MTTTSQVLATSLCLVAAHGAFACSCSPLAYAPACQRISNASISFLGTVRSIEGDPSLPNVGRARVYRFEVERVFKGLDPKTTEVVVNPENFSSCQTQYRASAKYIIFGSRLPGLDMIVAGGCSGSRLADTHPDDVAFLSQFAQGTVRSLISGRVVQWFNGLGWPDANDSAPVPGAIITLGDGAKRISRQTDLDGAFRFESLNSGKYTLSAQAGDLGTWGPNPVEVAPSSCSEVFPLLSTHTTLSGTMTLESGAPAKKQRVEVVRKNRSNVWYATTQFWTQTDEDGRFGFKDLPIGDYLVGHEIWSDHPSQYSAYPTQYFPGVAKRDQATIVHLSPQQSIENLSFHLSQPHTSRTVRVEVVWPDGTSPTEHLLQLFDGRNLITNIGWSLPDHPPARHKGIIEFKGYEERTYKLHARYWIDDVGGDVPSDQQRIALTEVKEVAAGKDVSLRLVLSKTSLASEER